MKTTAIVIGMTIFAGVFIFACEEQGWTFWPRGRAYDLASYCRLEKGLEPVSERRCYKPSMGSDALRERKRLDEENT